MSPDAADDGASWRLADQRDIPFVYELITAVDPRWWRFSRQGLEPSTVLATAASISAGVIVVDGAGRPAACALLVDTGAAGTGTLEYFALPNRDAQALANRFAPDIVAAAFAGAPVRRLYHERFAGDPEVLGAVAHLFLPEVVLPEFALVDGSYEDRIISVLTPEVLTEWRQSPEHGS